MNFHEKYGILEAGTESTGFVIVFWKPMDERRTQNDSRMYF